MKLYSLLLLSLAIVGCAPPYIAELDSAAPLARQMTLLGTFGPVSTLGGLTTSVKFLPVKPTAASIDALSVQAGFLVTRSPGAENLRFVNFDPSGFAQISGFQSFPLAGADPNYPLYEYDVIATTSTANILVFHFDAASIGNNTVQLFTAGLPSGPFQNAALAPNPQFLNGGIFGSAPVLAAQVLPLTSATDNFYFFYSNAGITTEGTASLAASVSVFATGSPGNSLMLAGAGNRLLYYRNQSASVVSYNTGGKWVCYRWDQSTMTPVLLTGITHRIDALLTNGDLISTEGETLRIYDSNGSEVLSAGLGALQFCYEAYVGATPYVFFSLSMDLPHDSWVFRVYAIPTSSLRGLSG